RWLGKRQTLRSFSFQGLFNASAVQRELSYVATSKDPKRLPALSIGKEGSKVKAVFPQKEKREQAVVVQLGQFSVAPRSHSMESIGGTTGMRSSAVIGVGYPILQNATKKGEKPVYRQRLFRAIGPITHITPITGPESIIDPNVDEQFGVS